jgi:seryl-tRNA synthetase
MLDTKFILENPEEVRRLAKLKGYEVDTEELAELATRRRMLSRRRTELGRRVRELSTGADSDPSDRTLARRLREESGAVASMLAEAREKFEKALMSVPNLPADDVPAGTEGERPAPAASLDPSSPPGLDSGAGAAVSGRGAALWKGKAAELEEEVVRRLVDDFTARGYALVTGGPVVTARALEWAGFLPRMRDDVLEAGEGLFVSPGPEAVLVGLHAGERLDPSALPLAMVSAGWCYRAWKGHGARGRKPAQYRSVDLFAISLPSPGRGAFEKLVSDARDALKALGLGTRESAATAADLSFASSFAKDILVEAGDGISVVAATVRDYGEFLSRRSGTRLSGGGFPFACSCEIPVQGIAGVLYISGKER